MGNGTRGDSCNVDGVAVCRQQDGAYFNLGTQENAAFRLNKEGNLILTFTSSDKQRNSNIQLACVRGAPDRLVVEGVTDHTKPQDYDFILYSECACPNGCVDDFGDDGMSTGSILLLILFLLVVIYLVGGVLYLYVIRGARGIEMIPNYEFWTELPGLIRDGVLFLLNGCKPHVQYDKI